MLFSCREESDIIEPPVGPDPKIVVNGTVNGQILDTNGAALENATIEFGSIMVTSDEYGVFNISDTNMFQDGTHITASKDGYITGSRLFYPNVNETSHVIIQLIEKTVVDVVSSSTGKKVEFDGASITFPANGFVTDDGSDYSGNVNVFAKWLNPEADATFNQMPGDLVGVNTDDQLRALATYGMLAVELEDPSGNHLQIKEGFTADIQVPVPANMQANAPAEIPLWHFNMESGYWVEEGSAQLVNGVYEGEVSHFSFWNCDAPFPLIQLTGTVHVNGNGMENVKIRITDNSTGFSACGYTTNRGMFTGKVPQDQNLTLEILDECGNVIYSDTNVGPYSVDATLALIDATTSISNPVTITGSVENCNGDDIDYSYVAIEFDNGTVKTYATEDDGTFSISIANCNSDAATVFGVDVTNDLISNGVVIDFEQDVDLGILSACEEFIQFKFIIEYTGSPWESVNSQDTVATAVNSQIFDTKTIYTITAVDFNTSEVGQIIVILNNGEVVADWDGEFSYDGFTCDGMNGESGVITNDLGQKFLKIKGTTTNISITDPNLYDPAITEVSVDINIEIQ